MNDWIGEALYDHGILSDPQHGNVGVDVTILWAMGTTEKRELGMWVTKKELKARQGRRMFKQKDINMM